MEKVSVVLPLYNGVRYIEESLESVIKQTYTNWEFIIVNEFGSDDGCAEIVKKYAQKDSRIILLQNTERLGLAESLNIGISKATGDYIARVDADDPSYPERFEIQVDYLNSHPEVALCGTIQRTVLPNRTNINLVPCDKEELKASMLFGCEISHCSVMFRRELFINNNWKYDPHKLGEDFDLWTRIMFDAAIVNIDQVLVDHRWGFDNISIEKGESLRQETREINARTLKRFGIDVAEDDLMLLSGWRNLPEEYAGNNISDFLRKSYNLLTSISEKNSQMLLIDPDALEKILYKRWNWSCLACGIKFCDMLYEEVRHDSEAVMISIVMPVYCNAKTVCEAVESLIRQEYTSWELLAICEFGIDDGTLEIIKYFAKLDKRIRVIENETFIGFADSLNKGVELAHGRYIARMNAFDISEPQRLGTQLTYMEENPDVDVTQCYEQYFNKEKSDFVKRPPISSEEMKARLLFFNAACESTLMIRRDVFDSNDTEYKNYGGYEDYEHLLRLSKSFKIETIPNILGRHRRTDRIFQDSNKCLAVEITREYLMKNLNIRVKERLLEYVDCTVNYKEINNEKLKYKKLSKTQSVLYAVYKMNCQRNFYACQEFVAVIAAVYRKKKYDNESVNKNNSSIFSALEASEFKLRFPLLAKAGRIFKNRKSNYDLYLTSLKAQSSLENKIDMQLKEIDKCLKNQISDALKKNNKQLDDQLEKIDKQIERWTWDRHQKMEPHTNLVTEYLHGDNLIPYLPGEKIRVVFCIQVAAFYPSMEFLINSMRLNDKYDVKIVCYIGEDGLLYCGKCNTPKQFRVKGSLAAAIEGGVMNCACKCEEEKRRAEEEQERTTREKLMLELTSPQRRNNCFSPDLGSNLFLGAWKSRLFRVSEMSEKRNNQAILKSSA